MVFFILVGILVIGFITYISKAGSETLTEYADKNPDAAYAQTGESWKDAYSSPDTGTDVHNAEESDSAEN